MPGRKTPSPFGQESEAIWSVPENLFRNKHQSYTLLAHVSDIASKSHRYESDYHLRNLEKWTDSVVFRVYLSRETTHCEV